MIEYSVHDWLCDLARAAEESMPPSRVSGPYVSPTPYTEEVKSLFSPKHDTTLQDKTSHHTTPTPGDWRKLFGL